LKEGFILILEVCVLRILLVLLLAAWTPMALAIEKIEADAKGVQLCELFLKACQIEDPKARLEAVVPLMHKSMLSKDGKDLDRNVKEFSYAKACGGAKFYAIPVEIYEVHKGNVTTIGFKETAERGRTDKYFVAKKAGQAGRPAPLHVFWPEDGGPPKLVNVGSL
jgi:hypothetical protein